MSESTKGGNVILEQVAVPADAVEPGEPFEVSADVSNGAAYISFADADDCKRNHTAGYRLEVVFTVNGETQVAGPACHLTTAVGKRTETYSKTFTVSDSGSVDVEAYVRLPGSGKETGEMSQTVTVTTDEVQESDPPAEEDDESADDDDSDGGNNPLAGIFPFGGGGGGGLNALLGVVVLLAIAWMLDSGSDIAG